ncbi:MAG: hypothetical protein AAGA48_14300 [Myxococcota bacterium]
MQLSMAIVPMTFAATFTLGVAVSCATPTTVEQAVVTSPLVGATRVRSDGEGEVTSTLRTGSYTYFQLDAPSDRWFVVMGDDVGVGERVTYRGYAEIESFRSTKLDRTFDRLVFASIRQTP